jgi:hypothetical protein
MTKLTFSLLIHDIQITATEVNTGTISCHSLDYKN